MAVYVVIDGIYTEIGTGEFVHAFFSTISGNLEPEGWGTRFPLMMLELYQGKLTSKKAQKALQELQTIKNELKKLPPELVIWDIDDRQKMPPWGNDISEDITDLSNYFITSGSGRDVIEAIEEILEISLESKLPITIE